MRGPLEWLRGKLRVHSPEPDPDVIEAQEQAERFTRVIDLGWEGSALPEGPCINGSGGGFRFIVSKRGVISEGGESRVTERDDWSAYVRGANGFGTPTQRAEDPLDLLPEMLDIAWRSTRDRQRRDEGFILSLETASEYLDARIGEWCDCGVPAAALEPTMEGLSWWCSACGLRWPVETPTPEK